MSGTKTNKVMFMSSIMYVIGLINELPIARFGVSLTPTFDRMSNVLFFVLHCPIDIIPGQKVDATKSYVISQDAPN